MSEDSRRLWVGEELHHNEGHRVGGILEGEVTIQRIAVSSPPSSVWVTTLHWIVSWLFKPVLGLMLDFVDK